MDSRKQPKVMGILNINNESFYSNSRATDLEEIDARIRQMLADGADIIDIGACSTRPGSTPVSEEQEWKYLQEPLRFIKERYFSEYKSKSTECQYYEAIEYKSEETAEGKLKEAAECTQEEAKEGKQKKATECKQKEEVDGKRKEAAEEKLDEADKKLSGREYENKKKIKISIDTFRSGIVRRAYDIIGEFIVNDISAGEDDPLMLQTVGELGLPYIAMHKRGTPATMQQMCDYKNGVVCEVIEYFKRFEERAAKYGIKEYVLDPGFGFAKTLEQNYELFNGMPQIINEIKKFSGKKRELLVGISRKGMIWKPLGITPEDALSATTALNLQALQLGADILRVHDVREAVQCIRLWQCLNAGQTHLIPIISER